MTRDELAEMRRAETLLDQLASALTDAQRTMLTRAVELLTGTDWHRSDALAAESQRLEAMRE